MPDKQLGLAERATALIAEDGSYDIEELLAFTNENLLEIRRQLQEPMVSELQTTATDVSRSAEDRRSAHRGLAELARQYEHPRFYFQASARLASLRRGTVSLTGRAPVQRKPRTPHRAGRSAVHGASRRASARSGDSGSDPDGDSDPEGPEPADVAAGRCCDSGCRSSRHSDACRQRLSRTRPRPEPAGLKPGPAFQALVKARTRTAEPVPAASEHSDPTVSAVLAGCGSWPSESRPDRARLIAHAARLGIRLSDTAAGAWIDRSYRESPHRKLDRLATTHRAADREITTIETNVTLPNNVTPIWWRRLPPGLPDSTVADLLGLPLPTDLAVAA